MSSTEADRALQTALLDRDYGAVCRAVDAGADRSLLHDALVYFAGMGSTKERIDDLIARGADVNGVGRSGRTALHVAASDAPESVIKALLARGASIEQADVHGCTALHRAASGSFPENVQVLLDRGAAIEARDGKGATPLHHAVVGGKQAAWRSLLDHGADVHAVDDNGQTPLHVTGWEDAAVALLGRSARIDAADLHGNTPLHGIAERASREDVMRVLLDHGADPNAKNDQGQVPLHHAAAAGNEQAVRVLLDHGANLSVKDREGKTPLRVAEERVAAQDLSAGLLSRAMPTPGHAAQQANRKRSNPGAERQ